MFSGHTTDFDSIINVDLVICLELDKLKISNEMTSYEMFCELTSCYIAKVSDRGGNEPGQNEFKKQALSELNAEPS